MLAGNGTGYDLDAVKTGWAPLANHIWVTQNIKYDPTGGNGLPELDIAQEPYLDVTMNGSGPWTYADCANAPYSADVSPKGRNVITGTSLRVGEGICVATQDTATKFDGNHIVLLVIKSVSLQQVTLDVTVWY